MRILFIVEANRQIGFGHAARCLALAERLVARGHSVAIASSSFEEPLKTLYRETVLGSSGTVAAFNSYRLSNFDWVVIDSYACDKNLETLVAQESRLLRIDDFPGTATQADLYVNHNPDAEHWAKPDLKSNAQALLGTNYFLLRNEFSRCSAWQKRNAPPKFLVSLGGSEINDELGMLMDVLAQLTTETSVRIVGSDLESTALGSHVELLPYSTDIATHLNWADYVFSGAGTTALETCCVGRGLFVCVLAENQKNVAKYLIDKGLATLMTLGAAEHLLESAQRIEKILGQENALREQIERQKLNFDGRGAEKICEIMEARSITE